MSSFMVGDFVEDLPEDVKGCRMVVVCSKVRPWRRLTIASRASTRYHNQYLTSICELLPQQFFVV